MTPLNCAANAVADLRALASRMKDKEDAGRIMEITDFIEVAQHFQLPEDGRIFDDELRGVKGQKLHLPFGLFTLEYAITAPPEAPPTRDDGKTVVDRALFLVSQIDGAAAARLLQGAQELNGLEGKFAEGGVIVMAALRNKAQQKWKPYPVSGLIPCEWEMVDHHTGALILPVLHNTLMDFIRINPGTSMKQFGEDILKGTDTVLEFCEAMSCSNIHPVSIQKVDASVNARRVGKGKLPLFETKVLMVDMDAPSPRGESQGGHHRSPRQHLRRGHIRRYASGKQVWVQAHVVGDAKKGTVSKTYVMT
jgi:hypothetical protein